MNTEDSLAEADVVYSIPILDSVGQLYVQVQVIQNSDGSFQVIQHIRNEKELIFTEKMADLGTAAFYAGVTVGKYDGSTRSFRVMESVYEDFGQIRLIREKNAQKAQVESIDDQVLKELTKENEKS